MKELTDSVKKIAELATVLESFTDQQILDKKAAEAVQGFSALGQMKSGKEITCVFEFEDGKHPLVAYLDESYFRCGQDSFVGQAYLLCKIIRKVPKGQSIKLDEIFDDIKKLPLNRAHEGTCRRTWIIRQNFEMLSKGLRLWFSRLQCISKISAQTGGNTMATKIR